MSKLSTTKGPAAAPAQATPPPAANTGAAAPAEAPKRTRSAISNEKRLAMIVSRIIAAHLAKDSNTLHKVVEEAKPLIKEFEDKIFTPLRNRLTEIHREMQEALAQDGSGEKMKALAAEQVKLENKVKALSVQTGAAAA